MYIISYTLNKKSANETGIVKHSYDHWKVIAIKVKYGNNRYKLNTSILVHPSIPLRKLFSIERFNVIITEK